MRGIIQVISGHKIQLDNGKTYPYFKGSWQDPSQHDVKRNRLIDYEVEFELEGDKVKPGSLRIVEKKGEDGKGKKGPAAKDEPKLQTGPTAKDEPKGDKQPAAKDVPKPRLRTTANDGSKEDKEPVAKDVPKLKMGPTGKDESKGEGKQPTETMSERRKKSPVLSSIQGGWTLDVLTTKRCPITLATIDRPKGPQSRPDQQEKRECFESREAFFKYMDQGFDDNAENTECLLCYAPNHGSGKAQTFRQYYRLDDEPIRMEELEIALEWKRDCKCNGWVFPHPPNNVFRRATEDEHESTVKTYDKEKQEKKDTGLRNRDKLLLHSNMKPVEGADAKINHLVPKSGGGCPVGVFNLQVHKALCDSCQKLDDLITEWQTEDKELHKNQLEVAQRRREFELKWEREQAEEKEARKARAQEQERRRVEEKKKREDQDKVDEEALQKYAASAKQKGHSKNQKPRGTQKKS